ncbi:hypothetical protein [Sphingomonas pituitosa]|uniref:hypothetical protein n=1 Tax=Sphingomonas pituitosa TaxID=99597 RepID=UPI00082E0BB9|nr:hypothetical protein [Sphingomonas pituitosa]
MSSSNLLADVETFLKRTGMADSALGRGAVNDWRLVSQLRAGRRVWPETEQKVRRFMEQYEAPEARAA